MPRLTTDEQMMSENQLIYKWLTEGRISCEKLIEQYANTLRKERDTAIYEATSYTYPLYLMQQNAKLPTKKEWIRDKATQMLYAFDNKRNGINFKKTFKEEVEQKKLNTDLDTIQYVVYQED